MISRPELRSALAVIQGLMLMLPASPEAPSRLSSHIRVGLCAVPWHLQSFRLSLQVHLLAVLQMIMLPCIQF